MDEQPDLEGLERDLASVAQAIAPRRFAAERVERRLRRVERAAWNELAWTSALMVACVALGSWPVALGLLLAVLPTRLAAVRERRIEIRRLAGTEDLFELERRTLERSIEAKRLATVLDFTFAALFIALTPWLPRPSMALFAGGFLLAAALAALCVHLPRLDRALRDTGGEPRSGWKASILRAIPSAALPVLVLFGMMRRGVRRLLGHPQEEDER